MATLLLCRNGYDHYAPRLVNGVCIPCSVSEALPDTEVEYNHVDEVIPTCDVCNEPDAEGGLDWNGETGCHHTCELLTMPVTETDTGDFILVPDVANIDWRAVVNGIVEETE